jgi:hypothetical protein
MNIFARARASALFRRDVTPTTVKDVIGWWESRRIPFNLIVGIAGVLTCVAAGTVLAVASILDPNNFDMGSPAPALILIVLYAILANICYTGGWIAELIIRKLWPHEADRFAMSSFFLGVVLSVLLTMSPGIVFLVGGGFGLIHHIWHVFHRI